MKMAKASEADIDAAMKLCSALESLERYRTMPTQDDDTDDADSFDENDREDCKKALGIVLELFGRASLFRVVFGMAVVLDPRNKIVDPDADVLEIHPDIRREQEDGKRFHGLLLWVLYHHQGGSSEIGQTIRKALGIGQHDHLTEEQVAEAKAAAGTTDR